jgi:hypothetical protein
MDGGHQHQKMTNDNEDPAEQVKVDDRVQLSNHPVNNWSSDC